MKVERDFGEIWMADRNVFKEFITNYEQEMRKRGLIRLREDFDGVILCFFGRKGIRADLI